MNRLKYAAAGAVIGLSAAFAVAHAQSGDAGGKFDEGQVKAIEQIVKDYLLKNPEILLEMQQAYEAKAEAQRAEMMKTRLPKFYEALNEMKDELKPFMIGQGDVTVVEFFDYNCGYCRRALPDVLSLVEEDKNVKALFLEFPVLSSDSLAVARVGIAAAKQGRYIDFHRAVMEGGPAKEETALQIAEKLGLDMEKLKADMASPDTAHLIGKLAQLGRELFIDGTPSFIIGDKVYPGAAELEQLQEMVTEVRESGCQSCVKSEKRS